MGFTELPDLSTDQIKLVNETYRQALAFAWLCDETRMNPFETGEIAGTRFVLMPAAFSMVAFSCELFLKTIHYSNGLDIGFVRNNYRHGLDSLFTNLPDKQKSRILNDICCTDNIPGTYEERIAKSADSFMRFRYAHEHEELNLDITFLSAFLCALQRECTRIVAMLEDIKR